MYLYKEHSATSLTNNHNYDEVQKTLQASMDKDQEQTKNQIKDYYNTNPELLHHAMYTGNLKLAQYLIDNIENIDINHKIDGKEMSWQLTDDQYSPLTVACYTGKIEMIDLLLKEESIKIKDIDLNALWNYITHDIRSCTTDELTNKSNKLQQAFRDLTTSYDKQQKLTDKYNIASETELKTTAASVLRELYYNQAAPDDKHDHDELDSSNQTSNITDIIEKFFNGLASQHWLSQFAYVEQLEQGKPQTNGFDAGNVEALAKVEVIVV